MTDLHLPPAEIKRLEAVLAQRHDRVEVLETTIGRVIVKRQRAPRHPARYRVLNAIARLLGASFLRAAPVRGGVASQAIEVRRLQALGEAGLPVPQVVHVAPDYFAMTWLGGGDLADLLTRRHPRAFDLWRQAGNALVQVHQSDQYLSQCFDRNMILDNSNEPPRFAGMIDFEDDPLEVMGLHEAQVRDWLTYLQSTLWNLPSPAPQVDAALDAFMQRETPAVRDLFATACRRLSWLRHLPRSRKFGRDTLAVQAVAAAAHRWNARHA